MKRQIYTPAARALLARLDSLSAAAVMTTALGLYHVQERHVGKRLVPLSRLLTPAQRRARQGKPWREAQQADLTTRATAAGR